MIAVDTNVLVYAHRADVPFHAKARQVLRGLAEGPNPWALFWPCIHEFLAVVTHARIWRTPSTWAEARSEVEGWLGSPTLSVLAETDGYWPTLVDTLGRSKVSGPRVHDARIAALATHHGVTQLLTADRDFSRFTPLKVRNPLLDERNEPDR